MGLRTFSNLLHIDRTQRWGRAAIDRSQFAHFERLVARAARNVPLYRKKYAEAGFNPDVLTSPAHVGDVPILTKSEIKAGFPDRNLADGVDASDLYPIATSGTTDRVMTFHDECKRDWDRAADLYMALRGNRFRPGDRQAIIPADACYERCGADEHGRVQTVAGKLRNLWRARRGSRQSAARQVLSLLVRDYFWRQKMLPAIGVDGTATAPDELQNYIDQLHAWRPQVFSGLPIYLYLLAKHHGTNGTDRFVRFIRPAGGKLTDQMAREVEDAFGAVVRENFGTAELGTVGFDCRYSRWQHVLSELFLIEFVRHGRPVAPGEQGELVITDLRNNVAPLVRYAVGDVGRYSDETCACGFAGRRFSIDGTIPETIVAPDGRAVPPNAVVDLFLTVPEILYVKIVQQRDDLFTAEIVPTADGVLPTADLLSERFSGFLDYRVTVRPRRVRRLAPERSGKYKLVSSSSFNRFHAAADDTATACGRAVA